MGNETGKILENRKCLAASMTIEAALSLPLFVFFAISLMQPIQWLDRQRMVQTAVECFCEDLSQYAYVRKMLQETSQEEPSETERQEKAGTGTWETEDMNRLLSSTAAGLWIKGKAETYVDGVMVTKADVLDEQGDLWLELEYKERFPFFQALSGGTTMCAAAKRRAWIGLDGKLKEESSSAGGEDQDAASEWVYVGAGMGRYHLYRDCHYISNQYLVVPLDEAVDMRNSYGRRLTACSRCGAGKGTNDSVYITSEGEHYHFSQSCSAMAAYVRRVQKKEVEHLGLCSYCARMKGETE